MRKTNIAENQKRSLLHFLRPLWNVCNTSSENSFRTKFPEIPGFWYDTQTLMKFFTKDVILIFWTPANFSCSLMEQFLIGVTDTAKTVFLEDPSLSHRSVNTRGKMIEGLPLAPSKIHSYLLNTLRVWSQAVCSILCEHSSGTHRKWAHKSQRLWAQWAQGGVGYQPNPQLSVIIHRTSLYSRPNDYVTQFLPLGSLQSGWQKKH